MKILSRLFTAAFILFAAASCHTNEIDNPDNNQNPEKPQSSEVKLMAKIPQTRVTYTSTGSRLDQAWKEGDIVFGFYEEDSRVILRVGEPDEDGTAPLSPVSGYERFITELVSHATDADHLPVALVYTGSTSTDESQLRYEDNTITVSKNNQSSGQLPACMHANGYAVITDSESKTFVFDFDNDCAIFEIIGITGAEALSFGNKNILALDYINVTNVINSIEYSYSDGDITFAPNTDFNGIVKSPSGIYVDRDGNVVDSNGSNTSIMMAVVPNGEQDFSIKIDFENSDHLELPYHGNLAAGKCYVFSQKAIVAAVGNEVFETVTDAFTKAKDNYLAGDPNPTVVLVRDCGFAGVTKNGNTYNSNVGVEDSPIVIDDYNVSLDLNGHILKISGDESFYVNYDADYAKYTGKSNVFTIMDSKTGGTIESTSDDYIVRNYGTVNIKGGYLHDATDYDGYSPVKNYGTLNVSGGHLQSETYYAIVNYGPLNITGGEIVHNGVDFEAIASENSNISINEADPTVPTIISTNAYENSEGFPQFAISSICDEAEDKYEFVMSGGTVTGPGGAVRLNGYIQADIFDGTIQCKTGVSLYISDGVECAISGGTIGRPFDATKYVDHRGSSRTPDDNGYALQIDKGSTCTITGGVIYTTGGKKNPAIWVDSSSLTIDWKKNNSNEPITTNWEPLIYSSIYDRSYTCSTVTSQLSGENSSVSVNLLGGYYYSKHTNSSGTSVLYSDDSESDGYAYLSSFGTVYSNVSKIHIHGSTEDTSSGDGVSIITKSPMGDSTTIKIKASDCGEDVNKYTYYFLDPVRGNSLDFRYMIETID